MTNPIDVERRFQDLLLLLSLPSSPRQRLAAIAAFLTNLVDHLHLFEPYALDLAQRVPEIVRHFRADGSSPDDLQSMYTVFARVSEVFPVEGAPAGYAETLGVLRDSAALQYAFVGMLAEALALYGLALPETMEELGEGPPLDRLCHALNVAKARKHASAPHLSRLLDAWNAKLLSPPNYTIIPVIERSFTSNEGLSVGRLRGMTVELFGEAKNGCDDIRADVSILENDRGEFFSPAISAARSLIRETHPSLAKRYVAGRVQFEDQNALHEGHSANLGIALLLYCEILRHMNQRTSFRLSSRASFTGNVSESGAILPIESSGLNLKVEAVFFSWVDFLVVPKQQALATEDIVEALHNKFPSRDLVVIGMGSVRDGFFDRRLTEAKDIGAFRHTARITWRKRWSLGALVGFIALAVIVARLLYGPIDRNPVDFESHGTTLRIKNRYNENIKTIEVGAKRGIATFSDVDGDGYNEVIWAKSDSGDGERFTSICCESFRKDSILWFFDLLKDNIDSGRTQTMGSNACMLSYLFSGDYEGTGRPVVISVSTTSFAKRLVFKLDGGTGRELGSYVHVGAIEGISPIDLDGDGIKELLAYGSNGSSSLASIVILDPRFIGGWSPPGPNDTTRASRPGLERAYILIPKTMLAESLRYDSKYSMVASLVSDIKGGSFTVCVHDVHAQVGNAVASIYPTFDLDLQLLSVETGDDYDILAKKMFDQGRFPFNPLTSYLTSELKRNIRYWDGECWQYQPVMNRHYLDALSKSGLPTPKGQSPLRK